MAGTRPRISAGAAAPHFVMIGASISHTAASSSPLGMRGRTGISETGLQKVGSAVLTLPARLYVLQWTTVAIDYLTTLDSRHSVRNWIPPGNGIKTRSGHRLPKGLDECGARDLP